MITPAQVEFYHAHGYLSVENVLSDEEVTELQRVTDEFVEKSRQVTAHTDVFDLEPGHSRERPRLRRLKDPAAQHPAYDKIRRHDRILDILTKLIGPNIRYSGNKLNMKSAEFGSPVEWHQDWAFHPHTNDDYVTIGVAIDDMTVENGALLVIPGSHKGRVYDHHQAGDFVGAITEQIVGEDNAVPIEVRAGGISIHHVRALHASSPNTSSQPRRLLLIDYCAVDAWPLMWTPEWDEFNNAILRGESTLSPRMTNAPVRLPLPSRDPSGIIFQLQQHLEKPKFRRG